MTTPPLRTIGYEASTFDRVREALLADGVRLLVDVRAVAASRKPGFSKRLLAAGLAEAGSATCICSRSARRNRGAMPSAAAT